MDVIAADDHLISPKVPEGYHYGGDVTPSEAWQVLKHFDSTHARLIDVRTEPEWAFVGYPDLTMLGHKPVLIPWRLYPDYDQNLTFVQDLSQIITDKEAYLFFLCKSGSRSRDAAEAMAQNGYQRAYNIAGGFEGDLNAARQRSTVNGWKAEGLSWMQA